jgi:hypothetical protein
MASEAAMALSVVGVVASVLTRVFSSLSVMVEVDGDLEKALRGPRWVSFSSEQGERRSGQQMLVRESDQNEEWDFGGFECPTYSW